MYGSPGRNEWVGGIIWVSTDCNGCVAIAEREKLPDAVTVSKGVVTISRVSYPPM